MKDASPSLFMSHIMVWPAPGSPSQQKHGIEVVSQSVREMQDTSLDNTTMRSKKTMTPKTPIDRRIITPNTSLICSLLLIAYSISNMMKVSLLLLLQLTAVAVAYSPLSPVPQTKASFTSPPGGGGETSRRNLLASVALGTSAFLIDPSKAFAATSNNLVELKDEVRKFTIKVPSDWDKTIQGLPDRRQITLYIKPNSDQKTLMFFAFTPVRDDFTSLGSFGSVDQVSCSVVVVDL